MIDGPWVDIPGDYETTPRVSLWSRMTPSLKRIALISQLIEIPVLVWIHWGEVLEKLGLL